MEGEVGFGREKKENTGEQGEETEKKENLKISSALNSRIFLDWQWGERRKFENVSFFSILYGNKWVKM